MDKLVVPEDGLVDIPEVVEDIEPTIFELVVVPEMDDKDLDKIRSQRLI